jgi:hypothetical protein
VISRPALTSTKYEIILPVCGLLYPRTSPFIFVRSTSSGKCIRCALFNLLGRSNRSKPVTSLSLHPSESCPPFNPPKTQDRCERAGKGGKVSLLPDRGPFACCRSDRDCLNLIFISHVRDADDSTFSIDRDLRLSMISEGGEIHGVFTEVTIITPRISFLPS